MYRRVVVAVSIVLFGLVALVAAIVTDLHDRSFPQALGATSSVTLDFTDASMPDEAAFTALGKLSDDLGLGLVKVAPNLTGNHSGQVLVAFGSARRWPGPAPRFGSQRDTQITDSSALAHSFASGEYLVTGAHADLGAFRAWLSQNRVDGRWSADGLGSTLALVVREASFATSLLAAIALMLSLVLFWLSVRARGRALRVLAGVPAWRVQVEDLGGFLVSILAAAVVCDAAAVAVVGFTQGWVFAPYYAQALLTFEAVIVLVTMAGALAVSGASWPTTAMLALREPAVKSFSLTSTLLKVAAFVLVVTSVAPAAAAYAQSADAAAQQSRWNSLADQVAITFPSALGEDGFQELMPAVAGVVRAAEATGAVGLSYTWTADATHGPDMFAAQDVALVNQQWLDLMLSNGDGSRAEMSGFQPIAIDALPADVRESLGPNLEIWSRKHLSADAALGQLTAYRYSGTDAIPMAVAGGGDLTFLHEAIVLVVPALYDVFNDSFLASLASSQNLVFAGLAPTMALVQEHGLQHTVDIKHVAEEGVLRAQYTAYFAWLHGASLGALVVALAVSAVIGALITAMLKARRDFPLRLAGRPWNEILAARVLTEWVPGIAITAAVLVGQRGSHGLLVTATAAVALLLSPVTHVLAARWSFMNLGLRRN